MNGRNAWPAVVIATMAVVAAGAMAVLGVSRDLIVTVLGAVVTPVILALVASQGAQTAERVHAVAQQTNGSTSRMIDIIEAQGRLLAASSPPLPSRPPSDRDTSPAGPS